MLERPLVTIGVMVLKEGRVLLGRRKGSVGAGEWGFPGGHLELGETFEEGIARELKEEVAIQVKDLRPICVANIQRYLPKQYIYNGFIADWVSGDPQLMEPEKCEGWGWYPLDDLPAGNMLIPELAIEAFKSGTLKYYSRVE